MIVSLNLTQKKMLGGWLTREKDHLMSIRALARTIVIPAATGSLEVISNDYDMVERLRFALRTDGSPDFLEEDVMTLIDIASSNRFADREEFWAEMKTVLGEALNVSQ